MNDYLEQKVVGEMIARLPADDKDGIKDLFCDCYCKFPEEYLSMHKDPDRAFEEMDRLVCNYCPLNK